MPLAIITALMTSSVHGMLGSGPQGGCRGPQEPTKPHPSTSIAGIHPALKRGKKDKALQIMSFMVQWPYRGSPPAWPGKMGKLIVALKQIGIIPLNASMSAQALREGGGGGGWGWEVHGKTDSERHIFIFCKSMSSF